MSRGHHRTGSREALGRPERLRVVVGLERRHRLGQLYREDYGSEGEDEAPTNEHPSVEPAVETAEVVEAAK